MCQKKKAGASAWRSHVPKETWHTLKKQMKDTQLTGFTGTKVQILTLSVQRYTLSSVT
jgi:hypothetical protein